MSFIELHYLENGEPAFINVASIDWVTKQPNLYGEHAVVMIGEYPMRTKETYTEVYAKICLWL